MSEVTRMIDIAKIKVRAGKGGDGKVSFRREKFIARGGPDGGDGGKGGNVYFIADNNMATLIDFRAKEVFAGKDGTPGDKKKMSGLNGDDVFIKIPVGTLVYEIKDNREILVADMDTVGKQFLIAKGGIGGKGNWRFKSSTNQTPTQYTPGAQGEEKLVKLEVKLVADVGLVGFPNAGKSTLLNKLTRSSAKVSNYPFTTLSPNLGTFVLKSGRTIVLSDIPGLIEGASEGKGLGDEFLRHVERTKIILHLIDPTDVTGLENNTDANEIDFAQNAVRMYEIIRKELAAYGHDIDKKEELVVINKMDITEVKDVFEQIVSSFANKGVKVFGLSGATGEGLDVLMLAVEKVLEKYPTHTVYETAAPVKLFNITNLPNRRLVNNPTQVSTHEGKIFKRTDYYNENYDKGNPTSDNYGEFIIEREKGTGDI